MSARDRVASRIGCSRGRAVLKAAATAAWTAYYIVFGVLLLTGAIWWGPLVLMGLVWEAAGGR